MRDRSMRSGTKFAREIQLTDWSTAGNLSNRSSGVQIPRDICTRFGRLFVLYDLQLDNKKCYALVGYFITSYPTRAHGIIGPLQLSHHVTQFSENYGL